MLSWLWHFPNGITRLQSMENSKLVLHLQMRLITAIWWACTTAVATTATANPRRAYPFRPPSQRSGLWQTRPSAKPLPRPTTVPRLGTGSPPDATLGNITGSRVNNPVPNLPSTCPPPPPGVPTLANSSPTPTSCGYATQAWAWATWACHPHLSANPLSAVGLWATRRLLPG